jgi:ankyrin repeat protein
MLLESGVDVNERNDEGRTALMFAAVKNEVETKEDWNVEEGKEKTKKGLLALERV